LVNLFKNPVIFLGPLVGERASTALEAFAPIAEPRDGSYLDLNFLTIANARVLVQLNDPAPYDSV
jgi:hypothetical protein